MLCSGHEHAPPTNAMQWVTMHHTYESCFISMKGFILHTMKHDSSIDFLTMLHGRRFFISASSYAPLHTMDENKNKLSSEISICNPYFRGNFLIVIFSL